jgi:hypothetical protein
MIARLSAPACCRQNLRAGWVRARSRRPPCAAHADTSELTDNPLVAPARVLTREPQHQRTDLLRDRGSTRSPSRIRPPSSHKLAMPTQQAVRRTKNDRLPRPKSWPAAARKTRSRSSSRGRAILRRSTASSWRSTTISSSLNSRDRTRSAATASARRSSRYSNDTTKKQPPSTRVREADSTAATQLRGASNHRIYLRTRHAPAH